MSYPQFGTESQARRKRVYYEGTDIIYEGMALCYNQDTTDNILGVDKADSSRDSSTAEGYQNEGKFLRVEKPATANLMFFAGVVAGSGYAGLTGPRWLDIYIPNEAIVPVRTSESCVIGKALGIANASYVLQGVTGDGDPLAVALAMETVDRSGTNGLVLAKLGGVSGAISAVSARFAPVRSVVTGYAYGVTIDGTDMLTGTAASKSYVMQISGDRESAVATGDSNDALLKITGNNYAACDTYFIFAGLNASINNRDGGTLGRIDHSLGVQGKSGGTVNNIMGLSVTAENYGTVSDLFGGIDVCLKNEAAVATKEFGIRIRNENNSIAGPVESVIEISETGVNTGFTNLLKIDAAATVGIIAASGDIIFTSDDKLIPVDIAGTTYYLVATDNV